MQSVKPETEGDMGDWAADARPARRLVLPRFLRRPARILSRLDLRTPRYAGTKGMALLFAATAATGMVVGGHTTTVVSALTAWAGLGIDEVEISGQSETSEIDVLNAMAIGPFPSIVTFDAISARERVERLPWVKRVTIRKLYPDTLQVGIVERQPYAIWQHDGAVVLINKDGRVLADHVDSRYAQLPMVVGKGADARDGEFVSLLEEYPSFAPRVRAGVLAVILPLGPFLSAGVNLARVKAFAFGGIPDDVIGRPDLLKLGLLGFVARIEIGMQGLGQLAIGLFDIGL